MFFAWFLNLYPAVFLLKEAPIGLNLGGFWPPSLALIGQIWKSVNCHSVREWASKSSFRGHPFKLILSFSCTHVPNLSFLWFQTYLYHILATLGIHCGCISHPKLRQFQCWFRDHVLTKKIVFLWSRAGATHDPTQERGEPGETQEATRGTQRHPEAPRRHPGGSEAENLKNVHFCMLFTAYMIHR